MGNVPSESNMGSSLRCYRCNIVLPPCVSFDNLYQVNINGRNLHVFNGGQYYRPVGQNMLYECANCLKNEEEQQRRQQEEQRRRQQEEQQRRQQEEQQRRQQEEQQREEERRRGDLNHRLQKLNQQAKAQRENQLNCDFAEELESKRRVLISHLNEFEAVGELVADSEELLDFLIFRSSVPVSDLGVSHLTADQRRRILSVLDKLLFDEWIRALPSISTLQQTQVFITELCAMFLKISDGVSPQIISDHVQSLVESISQSACNVFESFLLTQALYLTLMNFMDSSRSEADAVLVAKRWADEELSTEHLLLIDFLSTLTTSLQEVIERASVLILQMEIQCLKLLLLTLTHLNGKESYLQSTEMLLRLVQTNQWTPTEAVTLLKALRQKYAEDVSLTEVLRLVRVHGISPEWTDESGHSLIQALDLADSERFHQDFQKTLRRKDESSLTAALAELKQLWSLDDSVIDIIKNIPTGVLQLSENAPKDAPVITDSLKSVTLDAADVQSSLFQLCKVVFNTKGWWPTVRQMVRWCALVLTQKSRETQLVGVEEDPCVTAMFAAIQVCRGNKLDIVLSSDVRSERQTKGWSDFYKHLGISVNTNIRATDESIREIYEADVVYGSMDDFLSDYFQHGKGAMETGNPQLSRGFIIAEQSLRSSHNLKLSKLKNNDFRVFAAEILQTLMDKFDSEDMELRCRFIKALFQVLHTNLRKDTNTGNTISIVTISEKITGKGLLPNEVVILTFLENLLQVIPEETEGEKEMTCPAGKGCLESLFACLMQIQGSQEQTRELLQMVLNLGAQRLWSPVQALNLLGALTHHHHDKGCISILKILHLMATYQVSSKWKDKNNNSLPKLLDTFQTTDLIKHLEKSLSHDKTKSIDSLFDEIRQMKNIDDRTLHKSYSVVSLVSHLIQTGDIKKHTDIQQARNLSRSTNTEDLQELLAVLCNAVHQHRAGGKWWPRANQMISWCLLALSDTGKLLEMGTGEGKSCVIAMFSVLRALRGEYVDVVSSSSVLCQRDAEEWTDFYKYFGLTVDTNTNKTKDEDRKKCYQKNVVYGTIEAFAADHLRQIFEMKDVRSERSYQCIIIDEVDSLLLDQGVQLTYLSSPMVSMQHLNIILAMIWGHVSQYGFLSTGHQTFVQGPPASFYKAIFDSIATEDTELEGPIDILHIAEESSTVPKGFTEDIYKSETKDLLAKLKTVGQDAVVDFFQEIEQYVPYGFTVYTLDDNGLLCLRKRSPYNNQDIEELTFLVLEGGLCCPLYESEEILIKPIAEFISQKIQYTPCESNKDKVSIPGFLKNLIDKKLSVWVQNAFLAKQLQQGQEYIVRNDNVCPVDFKSTGIVELNKKWGDGLQQFVEIKHQVKLSTISTVTNYISNISFFEKYNGKIYGTTGTLGSKTDILFLQDLYPNLSACRMPTFNRKKLFEVKGTLKTSTGEWKSEIKKVVLSQISPNSYRDGRAALVICETINKAEEIYEDLKGDIKGEIILYCRSDNYSLSKIDKELLPGDVIVATNLAGRGTDIKVSEQVNNSGGLFVVLSFLSENTRVELQAFGRTARKGKPGSAQVIVSTEDLQQTFRKVSSLEEAKSTRDRLAAEKINQMMSDVTELRLREDLFSEYCKTLQDIYKITDEDDRGAVVAIMNEFWGMWLQTKSEEIDQLKRTELQESLMTDLASAKILSQSQTSPCSSFYHYIKFGNVALNEKQWDISNRLFEKAMKQDESWAAIAFYSHAFCTMQQQKEGYLTKAKEDLQNAQKSLKYLSEDSMVCLQFVEMASAASVSNNTTSLEKQLTTKCTMLRLFDINISEAIQKLDEIKDKGRDAIARKSPVSSLVAEEDLKVEAYNLYRQGLQYVFAVEEEPCFPWEALIVFVIGVLQIVAGTLIAVFTCGALAQVGMGLITEGISDCIYGIESVVTGEFSWKSWAIEKAISIGVSLIGFGVGKLIVKGLKVCKTSLKAFGKHLKMMPKFLSRQTQEGLSNVAKTSLKNAVKTTAKKAVEEVLTYGFGKAEEEMLKAILNTVKNEVEKGVANDVKFNMENEPLSALVDFIIFSNIENAKQLHDLLEDESRKSKLLATFTELSNTAMQPFKKDLSWQNKLNSYFSSLISSAKKETKGTARAILTAIQAVQVGAMAEDAINTVLSLSSKFFSNLHEQLITFKEEFSVKVRVDELSASDTDMLKKFKQDLADTISALMADATVDVFHQKISSHIVSYAQGKINGVLCNHVRVGLKSDRKEEKLMPRKQKLSVEKGTLSKSHAEKIRDPKTPGTLLDIRVLSEATGTKVVILTMGSHGRLTKMQELSPDTGPDRKTVTLIYSPKSAQHPDSHYDVHINNQTVSIDSENKSCLFHALAQGMKPQASKEEIASEADRLRFVEANTLLKYPGQWEPFIKRKEWTEAIRGGDWFLEEGAAKMAESVKEILKEEVGKILKYKDWKKHAVQNRQETDGGIGQFINADNQPPVNSILQARHLNQTSRLAEAMLEVAINSSSQEADLIDKVPKNHDLELPTVYVPKEVHHEFPNTISPDFMTHLASTISQNDVVGAFKMMILGALPSFRLKSDNIFNNFNFQSFQISKTRLAIFEKSFQQHSAKMVNTWFNLLEVKGVMTKTHLTNITAWIDNKGYEDQNDSHRQLVSNLLK